MAVPTPVDVSISLTAPPHVRSLLERLHARSLAQDEAIRAGGFDVSGFQGPESQRSFDEMMADKFVALDQDKCLFVYNLLRATQAKTVVEIGTSYGVSTVYLALAVGQNCPNGGGKVIATEFVLEKAKAARWNWREAGEDVEKVIDLREGDLRETLKEGLPDEIDFLLLDIWAPMALPALELVKNNLRRGAIIVTDNTIAAEGRYNDLFAVIRDPTGQFRSVTLPYNGGMEMSIYLP